MNHKRKRPKDKISCNDLERAFKCGNGSARRPISDRKKLEDATENLLRILTEFEELYEKIMGKKAEAP